MKTLLFAYILLCFYSCHKNKKQPSEVIAKPVIIQDTFMRNLSYQMSIQDRKFNVPAGIVFDTIIKKIKNGKITQSVAIPRLTESNLIQAEKTLRKETMRASDRFLKDQVYDNDKDYNQKVKNGEIGMGPVMIYKDNMIINYCFQLSYSDNILVRPYNEYYSVTYDLIKNRVINTSVFFKIKSIDDSMELSSFILNGFNPPLRNEFNFTEIDFSMDDSVIYFFTDQYQLGIPFNYSCGIRKKYLNRFIKDEYK